MEFRTTVLFQCIPSVELTFADILKGSHLWCFVQIMEFRTTVLFQCIPSVELTFADILKGSHLWCFVQIINNLQSKFIHTQGVTYKVSQTCDAVVCHL